MDKYTSALLKRLGSHSGVCNVSFEPQEPCASAAITVWDTKNGPYTLPLDFKAFLQASNGMTLTWDIEFRQTVHNDFACMHINSLSEVVSVPLDTFPPDERHHSLSLYDGQAETSHKGEPVKAFDIDSKCRSGRVCLLYFEGESDPQVWFQDLGCTWNFVASSFTEYFRVLALYLGLPHWQYAFTKHGLDPVVRKWVNFLCPGRLVSNASELYGDDDETVLLNGGSVFPSSSTEGNGKGAGAIASAAASAGRPKAPGLSHQSSGPGTGPSRPNTSRKHLQAGSHGNMSSSVLSSSSRPSSAHGQPPPPGAVVASTAQRHHQR